jgi:hypothetical protein
MIQITVTYRKHKYRKQGKYKCVCGKRFKRNESGYYTINPFNTLTPYENREKILESINNKLSEKECPACGVMVKPISVYAI